MEIKFKVEYFILYFFHNIKIIIYRQILMYLFLMRIQFQIEKCIGYIWKKNFNPNLDANPMQQSISDKFGISFVVRAELYATKNTLLE